MGSSDPRRASAVVVSAALVAAWWLMTWRGAVDPIVLPPPQEVVRATWRLVRHEAFLQDVWLTLRRVLVALAIALAVGAPAGLILGYRPSLYRPVEGIIHALRSVPATALFPLLLIVVGVGEGSLLTLATYPSLLTVLVNSAAGAALANPRRLHQARLLGLGDARIVCDVLLYEAMPGILAGARTAVSQALVLVIVVEMLLGFSQGGLGLRIFQCQSTYRIPETYASIASAAVVGILLNQGVSLAEKHLLRWSSSRK